MNSIRIFLFLAILLPTVHNPASADEVNCQWLVNEAIAGNPKDRYRKGYCSIKLGRFEEGLALLTGLDKEIPVIGDYILYYLGVGEKGLNRPLGAQEHFNTLLTRYPASATRKRALLGLARVYSVVGNLGGAEKTYRSLYSQENDARAKSEYLYNIAELLEKQGKHQEALGTYRYVWVEFPESGFAEKAIASAIQISRAQGIPLITTEYDYLERAERLFGLSRWSQALWNFEKAPSTDAVRLKIAVCKIHLGRLGEASNILAGLTSPDSLFWRAKISSKLDRDDEASQTYYQVYLFYPDSRLAPEALYNAARLYQINSNFDKALELYDLLVRKYPQAEDTEDGAWNLGWIYYRRGMYREALATFSAFTSSKSTFESSRASYWKAKTLEKQGKKREAVTIYETLSRLSSPSYYSYLARKKTGLIPDFNPSFADKGNAASLRSEKAELLIELGILEDAALEIEHLQREANTANELLYLSKLYAQVDDYYKSIALAQGIDIPEANRLSYPEGFREVVKGYSAKYGVDEFMVYSIIREESRYQKNAVSPAGAIGLMQLMPPTGRSTAKEVGINGYNTEMLNVPRVNIELGIAYFKKVLDLSGGNVYLAIASYNAGPHNVSKWVVRYPNREMDEFVEEIPFRETRNYVRRVLRSYGVYKALYDNKFL